MVFSQEIEHAHIRQSTGVKENQAYSYPKIAVKSVSDGTFIYKRLITEEDSPQNREQTTDGVHIAVPFVDFKQKENDSIPKNGIYIQKPVNEIANMSGSNDLLEIICVKHILRQHEEIIALYIAFWSRNFDLQKSAPFYQTGIYQ
ncbi:hypothetical protein [Parapedobacter sp. DT-150]|uniref:hypothetical protein n=1 Tax=Parapedobacter sp. DT-150 TaxID=3396162 RepID=UPI003F1D6B83